MEGLLARINITPGLRSGQPCIRNLRITVWGIFGGWEPVHRTLRSSLTIRNSPRKTSSQPSSGPPT